MVLQNVNVDSSWVQMNWKCSFMMNWPNMLIAVAAMLNTFNQPEVLAGEPGKGSQRINPKEANPEFPLLVLQGHSNYFGGRIQMIFKTNTDEVVVTVPRNLGFSADYEMLSKSFGVFMDHMELRMYKGA